MKEENTAKALEGEVVTMLEKQNQLEQLETELAQNETFQNFLTQQKQIQGELAEFWKRVEQEMIDANIKSIKGDWGSLTIAHRQNWKIDEDQLPAKFFKKVVDTSRITKTYQLEGKPIKGAEPYTTKYLTKKFKTKE